MSYLMNANMLIKLNKENKELQTAVNTYLEDIRGFEDYNAKVIGSNEQYTYINAGFYDDINSAFFDVDENLFDLIEKHNDGSFVVTMNMTDCNGAKIRYAGNVDFTKVGFDDITTELNWFTETSPKVTLKIHKDIAFEIGNVFENKLSKLFGASDLFDRYKEGDNRVYVFDLFTWRNFNKSTISKFADRIRQMFSFAQSMNLNVSMNFNEILVSEDCSSYIEMSVDDEGNVTPTVFKISE